MSEPLKVFITYSHKDTEAKDELITCLSVLIREKRVKLWHDNEILAGDKWREAISTNLTDSDILLYLVSAHSLASTDCNEELSEALALEKGEEVTIRIIPIILERCDWQNHQLSEFQALPDEGKPINEWQPESKGWQSVVNGIRNVVDSQAKTASTREDQQELLAGLALQQGNFLLMLGQVEKAIEAYSHAIELKSDFADAYNNRGAAYEAKGDHDHAIQDYDKVIALKPEDAIAYNNRGNAYGAKGDHVRAIQDYDKAIARNPDLAEVYNNRGNAYGKKGDHARAIQDYDKAIALNPDSAEAYYNRGNAYGTKGDYARAIQDYDKAIARNPDSAEVYCNRGNAYGTKGDHARAIQDYDKAIARNPVSADAYYNRGNTYGKKGDYARAIQDYDKAIGLNPDYAEAYNNRGIAYGAKGDHGRAIRDYDKVIALKPDGVKAYYMRGVTWLLLREWDKARSDLITARNKGVDIAKSFSSTFGSLSDFEQQYHVQLPDDIKEMLTP